MTATRTGALRWSDDTITWSEGATLPGQIEALAVSPLFAVAPEVIAMTASGAFRVHRDGAVDRWMGLQQADDPSHDAELVAYDPPSDDVETQGAMLAGVHALPLGAQATVWLRGSRVQLLGAAPGPTTLRFTVDDEDVGTTTTGGVTLGGVLAEADGLEDRLHLVTLTVLGGEGVVLDAAQGIGPSAPIAAGDSGAVETRSGKAPGDGCGCAQGAGHPALFVFALAALRRRRGGNAAFPFRRRNPLRLDGTEANPTPRARQS